MKTTLKLACASLLAACCLPASAATDVPVLKILNWNDYIAPEVIKAFEQEKGVRIEYTEYTNLDEFADKFINPENHFDLIFPPSRIVNSLAEKQLIRDLDNSRIAAMQDLRPDIVNEYALQDAGAPSGVPYMWGTTGLGVNVAELQKLGLAEYKDSWSLLFDPKVRAKAAQCGIGLLNERDELFAGALAYLGYSINSLKREELERAGELLKETVADVNYLATTQSREDLANKKICVSVGYSGDLLLAAGDDPQLAYFIPREGNALWIDAMAIPTTAQSPDLAYDFINYLMQPKMAAANSNYLEYPNPMASSAQYVNPDILNNDVIYPSVASLTKMEALAPRDRKTTRIMHRLWVTALCSRGEWCSVPLSSNF
ncbi:ABC transporter substrate-binding protein [Oceanobacter mangrovi]|uniref:ABC transporter substrate-binding protein n=1 Tax=Oceanobacter mangrovi TaxID=2862510 RepID=UPI001C8E1AE8|nr:extracellular solute-binding protein [Oceanobacter mangrovi]